MLATDRLLSNGALCLSLSVPRQRRSLLDEVDEARLQKSHQHGDDLGLVAWRLEWFQADAQTTLVVGLFFVSIGVLNAMDGARQENMSLPGCEARVPHLLELVRANWSGLPVFRFFLRDVLAELGNLHWQGKPNSARKIIQEVTLEWDNWKLGAKVNACRFVG